MELNQVSENQAVQESQQAQQQTQESQHNQLPEAIPQQGPKGVPNETQKIARIVRETIVPIQEQINEISSALESRNADSDKTPEDGLNVEEISLKLENAMAHIANVTKQTAIERALWSAGCNDTIAALAHIDLEKVVLDENGELEGIDVDALKQSYPYLFSAHTTVNPTVSTSASGGGQIPETPIKDISSGVNAALKKG